ncbi:hypothetical protein Q1695_004512 [Nippostrongylus brasiliensis]|nr:hypothetical protein Q1695_004512 [Nippostrongylus brasiliensis]
MRGDTADEAKKLSDYFVNTFTRGTIGLLSDAISSETVTANSTLKAELVKAQETLRRVPNEEEDQPKLQLVLRALTIAVNLRESLYAVFESSDPDLDYVNNVASAIYWFCRWIATFELPTLNKVGSAVEKLTIYQKDEDALRKMLNIADNVINEVSTYFESRPRDQLN